MKKVVLETKKGELVHIGSMPPFNEDPAVVIWGDRVFTHHFSYESEGKVVYREAFSYVLVG